MITSIFDKHFFWWRDEKNELTYCEDVHLRQPQQAKKIKRLLRFTAIKHILMHFNVICTILYYITCIYDVWKQFKQSRIILEGAFLDRNHILCD